MSAVFKLWAAALVACAIGTNAQAANVAVDREQLQEELETCWIARASGSDFSRCVTNASLFNGARQSDWIDAVWTCAAQENPLCIPMLAYIKEHWGVQAALGRARPPVRADQ
jgi:hypothetical protein